MRRVGAAGDAHQDKRVRLTGVSVQSLDEEGAQQLGLFSAPPARSAKLNAALDRIAERFGSNAITTADLTEGNAAVDENERWGRH